MNWPRKMLKDQLLVRSQSEAFDKSNRYRFVKKLSNQKKVNVFIAENQTLTEKKITSRSILSGCNKTKENAERLD